MCYDTAEGEGAAKLLFVGPFLERGFTVFGSVQDGICVLGKAHKYALHPVSQKSPKSCLLKQRYTNRGTGYGLHMDDMHNIYMDEVRCIHG